MCESVSTELDGEEKTDGATTAIVSGIAAIENVEPVELEWCLAEYVDPDALGTLLAHDEPRAVGLQIDFSVDEYEITVEDGDNLVVTRECDASMECEPGSMRQ